MIQLMGQVLRCVVEWHEPLLKGRLTWTCVDWIYRQNSFILISKSMQVLLKFVHLHCRSTNNSQTTDLSCRLHQGGILGYIHVHVPPPPPPTPSTTPDSKFQLFANRILKLVIIVNFEHCWTYCMCYTHWSCLPATLEQLSAT